MGAHAGSLPRVSTALPIGLQVGTSPFERVQSACNMHVQAVMTHAASCHAVCSKLSCRMQRLHCMHAAAYA
jgi:hypothetical protein